MGPSPVVFLAFADPPAVSHLPTLGDELRAVRDALKAGTDAGHWDVVERTGARIDDLLDVLRDPKYRGRVAVFHYGGHAAGDRLTLEAPGGGAASAHAAGLAQVLGAQHGLALVFLNGCSTAAQADLLLSAGVPAVITTDRAIDDAVASQFAADLYAELAAGAPLTQAFVQASAVARMRVGERPAAAYRAEHAGASRDTHLPNIAPAPELPWPWSLRTAPAEPAAATWTLRGPVSPEPAMSWGRRLLDATRAAGAGRAAVLTLLLVAAATVAFRVATTRQRAIEALRMEGVAVTDTAAFFRFVRDGNAPLVRRFLAAGLSPNVIDPDPTRGARAGPAVAVAAALGDTALVALLLDAGAQPDRANQLGYTALFSAVDAPHAAVLVRQLLAHGADPGHGANDGRLVLHDAAEAGDTLVLGLLLRAVPPERRAALFAAEGGERYLTPLAAAAGAGQVNAARMLIRAGAPADQPVARPPLCAASNGLIVNTPVDVDSAALHRARRAAVMRLLIDEAHATAAAPCGEQSVLEWPVRASDTTVIAYLLAHGADPNRAWSDQTPPVKMLLTWCEPALTADDLTGMRYLLAHGARADWRPDSGDQTPLMSAAYSSATACVDALLAAGADVNARDSTGLTPLLWGANPWNARVLTQLLAHGADPRAVDHEGATALMRLVYPRGDADAAERATAPVAALDVLLRAGVDGRARRHDGVTALDLARRNGYTTIAARLAGTGGR